MAEKEQKGPPSHSNLKWISGLLFTLFLLVTAIAFSLSRITSPEIAIPAGAYLVANQFSKEGLDEAASLNEIKKRYLSSGQTVFYPLGNDQPVTLTKEDLLTLSPREIRLKVFTQFVEPFYYQRASSTEVEKVGILSNLNFKTHEKLKNIFFLSLIPTFLFFIGLVFFSKGAARLTNPAIPLLVIGLPLSFLFFAGTNGPPPGDLGPLSFLSPETLTQIAKSVSKIFNYYSLAGGILLVSGLIVKITSKNKN